MSGRRIEIVIDELFVRGWSHAEAGAIAAALEQRLDALGDGWARTANAAPVSRETAYQRTPRVRAQPNALGGAVADAVWSAALGGTR
jgi:hypothetical protein